MQWPKVLIFTPIYEKKDYSLNRFLKHAKELQYPRKEHIFIDNSKTDAYYRKVKRKVESFGFKIYHIERGATTREALTRAQNFARRKAIEGKYDYMFSIESDVYVPSDALLKLLRHGKDVVTALYHIGDRAKGQRVPCITLPEWNETLNAWGSRLLKPEEFKQYENIGLVRVQAGGMGACLISKYVFEDTPFFYDPRFQGHSDIYFFNQMFMRRIGVYVDTNIICEHENTPWDSVEDR